jgi:UDP-arabinose 4-epimerase
MKTVLVTGGAGYVGSHACKALAQAGMTPVTYDNLSRGHAWAVKWGPLERGDISDVERLREVLKRHRPDAVLHFAGLAYVHESVLDPLAYFDTNVQGTAALLKAMRAEQVRRIVFSSSCTTYGVPERLPLTEDAPQRPVSPYGWSKLAAEQLIKASARAYGFEYALLRYFNAAGADAEGEIGEVHDPETHLIPNAVNAALPGGKELVVFGADYDTPDGTCIRDYVHVTDLADAHVRSLRAFDDGQAALALNVGSGEGSSIMQVIAAVERAAGRPVRYAVHARREGDPPRLVADNRRIGELLGWRPLRSRLDNIAATAWRWAAGERR